MNAQQFIIRLTRDPDLRFIPDGSAVAQFSGALDVGYGDKKKTVFLDFKIWKKPAETFANFVKKGHAVAVETRLDEDKWNDKSTGEEKKKLIFVVTQFTILNNDKSKASQPSMPERSDQLPSRKITYPKPEPDTDSGDDILY